MSIAHRFGIFKPLPDNEQVLTCPVPTCGGCIFEENGVYRDYTQYICQKCGHVMCFIRPLTLEEEIHRDTTSNGGD